MPIENAIKDKIVQIFGKNNVIEEKSTLTANGNPDLVVIAENKTQIIDLVNLAGQSPIPIIPKSSKIDYYDGALATNGGVLLDMSNMKKILNIQDRSERNVTIQPGVTFEELQLYLNEKGFKCMVPLGLPSSASVLSSYLERVPLLSAPLMILSEGSQCIMDLEVIRGDTSILHTGSAATVPTRPGIAPNGPIGPDWTRVFTAAQGTMGIVTEMTLKFKHIPKFQRILLMPYEDLDKMLEDMVKIKRMDIGKECLGMSSLNLAAILADDKAGIELLRGNLPKWTMLLNITGFDEKELELYQEDLKELKIQSLNDNIKSSVINFDIENILLKELNLPNKLVAHRKYDDICNIIPFYARKSRIIEFDKEIVKKAAAAGYDINNLHGYVMPIEQARIFYIEYTIYGEDKKELFEQLSEYVINNGGIIDRPYGIWRKMIYSKIPDYVKLLKQVKAMLDPHGIFNPGKIIPMEGA